MGEDVASATTEHLAAYLESAKEESRKFATFKVTQTEAPCAELGEWTHHVPAQVSAVESVMPPQK